MVWKLLLFIWMCTVIVAAFLYAPLADKLFEMTRIIYFHIPVAWVAVVAFLISTFYSIRHIFLRKWEYDAKAEISCGLGIVFCILALVSGAIFAKGMWGAYWNWDPRETSIFLLLIIYFAYFTLRRNLEGEERKGRLSAVYNIFAFLTVPFLVFIVPRLYYSLHPEPLLNVRGKLDMSLKMFIVLMASVIGFTCIYFWIFSMSWKIKKIEHDINVEK